MGYTNVNAAEKRNQMKQQKFTSKKELSKIKEHVGILKNTNKVIFESTRGGISKDKTNKKKMVQMTKKTKI